MLSLQTSGTQSTDLVPHLPCISPVCWLCHMSGKAWPRAQPVLSYAQCFAAAWFVAAAGPPAWFLCLPALAGALFKQTLT